MYLSTKFFMKKTVSIFITMIYDLTCTGCQFSAVVDGNSADVYETIEAHQDEVDAVHGDHLVNFQARSASVRIGRTSP